VRELDEALVQEVWDGFCGWGPERSTAEARTFIERQPHLVALADAVMEEFDAEAQKAAFGLVFLLTRVWEAHREQPLDPVSRERVVEAYEATLRWMDRWEGADERFLARSGEFPQPHLIPYLITRFYRGGSGNDDYEAEVRGSLFLVLKAAADALEAGPAEASGDAR
jgi:hypothetical protein